MTYSKSRFGWGLQVCPGFYIENTVTYGLYFYIGIFGKILVQLKPGTMSSSKKVGISRLPI